MKTVLLVLAIVNLILSCCFLYSAVNSSPNAIQCVACVMDMAAFVVCSRVAMDT